MATKPATKTSAPPLGKPANTEQTATDKAGSPAATVTLKQLAAELATAQGMEKRKAETVMTEVVGMLVSHLKAGDRLRLAGFGIIEVKDRPARTGRNPASGEAIQIAASRKVGFRAAKELKDAL